MLRHDCAAQTTEKENNQQFSRQYICMWVCVCVLKNELINNQTDKKNIMH